MEKLKNKEGETLKAGCILVDKDNKMIALVYRDYHSDYSFPKGHLEEGESLLECAIRETAEETKREAKIVKEIEPYIEHYITPSGEKCVCYMYVCLDVGKSDNTSTDTHDVVWTPFSEVEDKLSYKSLKNMWNSLKDRVYKLF